MFLLETRLAVSRFISFTISFVIANLPNILEDNNEMFRR